MWCSYWEATEKEENSCSWLIATENNLQIAKEIKACHSGAYVSKTVPDLEPWVTKKNRTILTPPLAEPPLGRLLSSGKRLRGSNERKAILAPEKPRIGAFVFFIFILHSETSDWSHSSFFSLVKHASPVILHMPPISVLPGPWCPLHCSYVQKQSLMEATLNSTLFQVVSFFKGPFIQGNDFLDGNQ